MTGKPTIDKFLEGLQILGHAVTGASFYNSSGGDAGFDLNRELTEAEVASLKVLGFWDYMAERNVLTKEFMSASISFPGWSDS